ncbi:helix-turn-helix domain-containing protein [Blautia obeum]|jgi:Na+-driven multidrug efflux pump|nr:helix-turn-helix domain-containing protein [Blautia obeum]MCB7344514.1 helix-turn-helix domain-containing protein [Blautia obeum]
MQKGIKFRIYPNREQKNLIHRTLGCCRLIYNKEMSQIARAGLRVYFIAFIPMGINLLTSYYLQSILSVKSSLFISLLRNVILSSTAILTFPLIFGGNSLWLVMPVVECLVLVLSVVFLRRQQ